MVEKLTRQQRFAPTSQLNLSGPGRPVGRHPLRSRCRISFPPPPLSSSPSLLDLTASTSLTRRRAPAPLTRTQASSAFGDSIPPHSASSSASNAGVTHASASVSASASPAPHEDAASLPIPTDAPAAAAPNSSFLNRVIYGALLGIAGAALIISGPAPFSLLIAFLCQQSSVEYFGFVSARNETDKTAQFPPKIAQGITLACMAIPLLTLLTGGKLGIGLALSTFAICVLIMFATEKPRLSHFTSATFGLLYCGFLPSFWVRLRLMNVPALGAGAAVDWPVALGGLGHWTLGLVTCFMAVGCVIAADTGAYFVGKNLGRTPLIKISPKKTVEGALGGWACSVAWAVACWRMFAWPSEILWAVVFGTAVFFSSLFGDLIESVMKRDAGLKDSGNLIPGHGGLLDRFDSYIFTGAVVYFFVKFIVPVPFGL